MIGSHLCHLTEDDAEILSHWLCHEGKASG